MPAGATFKPMDTAHRALCSLTTARSLYSMQASVGPVALHRTRRGGVRVNARTQGDSSPSTPSAARPAASSSDQQTQRPPTRSAGPAAMMGRNGQSLKVSGTCLHGQRCPCAHHPGTRTSSTRHHMAMRMMENQHCQGLTQHSPQSGMAGCNRDIPCTGMLRRS